MILFSVILGIAGTALALNDNGAKDKSTKVETKVVTTDTYFRFTGNPGEEGNPAKWEAIDTPDGCEGLERACNIQVKAAYLVESGGQVHINTSLLPTLPTVLSPDNVNLIPAPSAAGSMSSQPLTPGGIYNQD